MKRVIKNSAVALLVMAGVSASWLSGRAYERCNNDETRHYLVRSLQLTANDLPVYFVDQIPGFNGTKERPELCGAYYDTAMKSIVLIPKSK